MPHEKNGRAIETPLRKPARREERGDAKEGLDNFSALFKLFVPFLYIKNRFITYVF